MSSSSAEIGKRIQELRKQKGLTQSEFADLMKKSLRTIQKYESGEINIDIATVSTIARVLDGSESYIIGYDMDQIRINTLSDIYKFFFELYKKEGIKFTLDIHKAGRDGDRKCAIVFDGLDISGDADYNSSICLFLEEFSKHINEVETYWRRFSDMADWVDGQIAYAESNKLADRKFDTLNDEQFMKKKKEFMEKEYQEQLRKSASKASDVTDKE